MYKLPKPVFVIYWNKPLLREQLHKIRDNVKKGLKDEYLFFVIDDPSRKHVDCEIISMASIATISEDMEKYIAKFQEENEKE